MKGKIVIGIMLAVLIIAMNFAGFASIGSADPPERVSVLIGFRNFEDNKFVVEQGGEVKYSYDNILAVAASVPPQAIAALQRNPNVAYVENDNQVHILAQTTPWGITKINAPAVWSTGDQGTGIKVAIVDTGIQTNHPDLTVVGGATFVSGTSTYNDDHGHGTHCAGIVAALDNGVGVVGVAPGAALYGVKVLDSTGNGYYSDVVSGIDWCITNNMQVISMSLGGPDDATLHSICDTAYNQGIVIVAATGNSGPRANTVQCPGKYSSVIAVAATDSNDVVASFSSRGPELSVAAPGVNIYSTYKGSTYATMSGTSMACPHVTGTVALILARAAHTPAEVRTILQTTAIDLGTTGFDTSYGYGRIDAYTASLPPTPDFLLAASPSAKTINAGAVGLSAITATSFNTFSGTVALVAYPTGWTVSVNPTSLTLASGGTATTTLSITVPAGTASGTYTVTVTGTSGSLVHSTTVTVTVPAPVIPDFSLAASPTSLTIKNGRTGSSTITATSLNTFSGTVALTVTYPTLWTVSINPTSLTLASGGTATSKLSITVPRGYATGTYTIKVTGTSGSLVHTATVTVNVK